MILVAMGASAVERLWALAHPHNQAYLGAFMLMMLMVVGVSVVTMQIIGAPRANSAQEVPGCK
jgi:hypothetical protein